MRENIVISVGLRRALIGAAALSALTLAWAGSASARFEVGLEAFHRGDYDYAIDVWKKDAGAGDVRAMQMLGEVYSQNICGKKLDLPASAADPARRRLSPLPLSSEAVPVKCKSDECLVEALKWYTLAAYREFKPAEKPTLTQADVRAQIIAENCLPYIREEMTTGAVNRAEDLVSKWFESGSNYDLYNLGLMYQRGAGVDKNNQKALMLFELAKLRGVGEASAAYEKLEKLMDPKELEWAHEAAIAWQPPLPGEHMGDTPQMKELARLKKELEELRKEDALEAVSDIDVLLIQEALRSLGFYLGAIDNTMGPGTRAAIKKFQYSRVSADKEMSEEDKEAVKTGVLSASQTVALIAAAADAEHPKSQYAYGLMHARGIGVVQDGAQALVWLKKSAEVDYPLAHYALGVIYRDGTTGLNEVTPNKTLAARHFARANALGYRPAGKALELLEFEPPQPQE